MKKSSTKLSRTWGGGEEHWRNLKNSAGKGKNHLEDGGTNIGTGGKIVGVKPGIVWPSAYLEKSQDIGGGKARSRTRASTTEGGNSPLSLKRRTMIHKKGSHGIPTNSERTHPPSGATIRLKTSA